MLQVCCKAHSAPCTKRKIRDGHMLGLMQGAIFHKASGKAASSGVKAILEFQYLENLPMKLSSSLLKDVDERAPKQLSSAPDRCQIHRQQRVEPPSEATLGLLDGHTTRLMKGRLHLHDPWEKSLTAPCCQMLRLIRGDHLAKSESTSAHPTGRLQ